MTQAAHTVLMIRPACFGFNPETARTNAFQTASQNDVSSVAIEEFNAFAESLNREKINTIIFDDSRQIKKPDAVFPNNWFSTHADGSVILYPMQSPSRRAERRKDIIEWLQSSYKVTQVVDLSPFENLGMFLEGTGSMVFDHPNQQVFMAPGLRSHINLLSEVSRVLGYQAVTIPASGPDHKPVYHTNVLLTIGTRLAIVCRDWISDHDALGSMMVHFEKTGRSVIDITPEQAMSFAGNMLELTNSQGEPFLVMSSTAFRSLSANQKKTIEQFATPLTAHIPTIEKHGGGSVRCMMAEIFLPPQSSEPQVTVTEPVSHTDYDSYYALRWKVLRQPWNQPPGSERDDLENTSKHFMAVMQGKVVGTGRVQFNDETVAQIRYMAVDPDLRGKGIGKKIMVAMESYIRSSGRTMVFLQARENALPFYLSLGYRIVEKTILLYGEIQHFSMEKKL